MSATAVMGGSASTRGAPEKLKTRDVTRFQIDMPPRSAERLHNLKRRTEAASNAEVIRSALRLYEAIVDELENGRDFYVRDHKGTLMPYKIFIEA